MALLFFSNGTTGGFWLWPNFWIEIGFSIAGLLFSVLAFNQARKAKVAADKAGKIVKRQSIMLAVAETIKYCQQIRGNLNYEDSNTRLMEIVGKVRNVIGLYRESIELHHPILLNDIGACVLRAQDEFNTLERSANKGVIWGAMRPIYNTLAGHLSELQGVLENELIENSI
jgi:hypothetical protein